MVKITESIQSSQSKEEGVFVVVRHHNGAAKKASAPDRWV